MKLTRILWSSCLAIGMHILSGAACGQATGEFVIPSFRGNATTRFAYWDQMTQAYLTNNPVGVAGGSDAGGHASNYGVAATGTAGSLTFKQDGTPNAFITSSSSIYSSSGITTFTVGYSQPIAEPAVTNVVFQTQTGGTRIDLNNVVLQFTPPGGSLISVHPNFKALDDPQTGSFFERLVAAFQWDLTGYNAHDFVIKINSPTSSMPLWQAQLDVVNAVPFQQAIGYLLQTSTLPHVRFGTPGTVDLNLPPGAEDRFFLPGTVLHLQGQPLSGFSHVGWKYGGVVSESAQYDLTITNADDAIAAIFCPLDYSTWRDKFFEHANPLLGIGPDSTDDAISAAEADPDGDGWINQKEFLFGGNPYASDVPTMQPVPGVVSVGADQFPTLTFRRLAADDLDLSVFYEIEVSTDCQNWHSNDDGDGPWTVELSSTLQENGTRLVTVRSAQPITQAVPRQYLRLRGEEY